jgi:hypothetical protein
VWVIWNRRVSWNTPSLTKLEGKLFQDYLAVRVYVPDKMTLKINGEEGQPVQLFQLTDTSSRYTCIFDHKTVKLFLPCMLILTGSPRRSSMLWMGRRMWEEDVGGGWEDTA